MKQFILKWLGLEDVKKYSEVELLKPKVEKLSGEIDTEIRYHGSVQKWFKGRTKKYCVGVLDEYYELSERLRKLQEE